MLLWAPLALALELDAQLDRDEISLGDTVELQLRVDDAVSIDAPDFSALEQDFDILGQNRRSHNMIVNGKLSSSTIWSLTLLPKRKGFVAIPPLELNGAVSPALKLRVRPRDQTDPAAAGELLFVDASVDKDSVFVQEQLIYTIKIFASSVDLYDATFSPPSIDHAVMEKLGDRSHYRSTINGQSYEVTEFKYALFPQESGQLVIPPAVLTANVFQPRNQGFNRSPFNGKPVRKSSPELALQVKERPSEYPANKAWLPARGLTLTESWSADTDTLSVGTPVTRTLTIQAEGLPDSALPPIAIPAVDGLKIYRDKADSRSEAGRQGLSSVRQESRALIPTQAGTLELPPIELHWWDTQSGQMRIAQLPARTLTVTGSATNNDTTTNRVTEVPPAPSQTAANESAAPSSVTTTPSDQVSGTAAAKHNRWWFWVALFGLLGWACTAVALTLFLRRQRAAQPPTQPSPPPHASVRTTLQRLRTACEQGQPQAARQAVIQLFNGYWQDITINSTDQIRQRAPGTELAYALDQLDATLYRPETVSSWRGERLLAAVEEWLQQHNRDKSAAADDALAPLHPH